MTTDPPRKPFPPPPPPPPHRGRKRAMGARGAGDGGGDTCARARSWPSRRGTGCAAKAKRPCSFVGCPVRWAPDKAWLDAPLQNRGAIRSRTTPVTLNDSGRKKKELVAPDSGRSVKWSTLSSGIAESRVRGDR